GRHKSRSQCEARPHSARRQTIWQTRGSRREACRKRHQSGGQKNQQHRKKRSETIGDLIDCARRGAQKYLMRGAAACRAECGLNKKQLLESACARRATFFVPQNAARGATIQTQL